MILIGLFTKYFLFLTVFLGIIVGFFDAKRFKKNNMKSVAKKARILGISCIILCFGLFLLRSMLK